MAPPRDLREWIALLEREGELVRIATEVDPELEITEINDRVVKQGGPALLFEHVKGSDRSLLINQFGTERRMAMAFDAPSLDAVAEKLSDVLEMQPPQGLVEKVRGLQKLGPRATAMHWQIHKDGRADYLATDGKIEVAVALGTDPVTTYAASAPLPKHIDELMLAGFLRGEPVELVRAKTVAVDVPANAEIVLEGFIQ